MLTLADWLAVAAFAVVIAAVASIPLLVFYLVDRFDDEED